MKRPSIRNILVPIDFSKMSIGAIKIAKQLARRLSATIHLAHVRQFDYTTALAAPAPPLIPFSFTSYEWDEGKRVLKELNALGREYGISRDICHVLRGGPAFDEICRLAQKIAADLIVMPTHGRTGLKHIFLGSTAEGIVQHSPCPVLVTRGIPVQSEKGSPLTIRTILVPVDFSPASRESLQYAIGFAKEYGAKIILLHATYLGYIYSCEGVDLYDVPGLEEAARNSAEHKMRKLLRAAKFGRTKYQTALTDSSPALDICAFAKQHHVDLIITSTHGFTGLEHMLMGSVAEQVVRRAVCSVLVVPSHPQSRMATLAELHERTVERRRERGHRRKSQKANTLTKRNRKLASRAD